MQKEFVSEQTMIRVDRDANQVSVTPIISWHDAEFVAAYDPGATGAMAQRSPIERAIVAFVTPHAASAREGIPAEERIQGDISSVRLAAQRSDGRRAEIMDLQLTDKIAIVTGSSRGLGLASARSLIAEGCRVCICARGPEQLAAAAIEVEAVARRPNMIMTVQADVSTADGIAMVIDRTVERFGGLDILVNNVGRAAGKDLLDTSDAEWQAAFDETLFPAIRASRLAVPHMKQRGGGAIIMIASIWGRESGGRMTYNAVKAAEISLAKIARAAARAAEHSREQRRAGLDPVSRRLVAQTAAGRSAGHRRVHQARSAFRPHGPRRRSRHRRRISRLAARQLDQRRVDPRRWLSVEVEYLTAQCSMFNVQCSTLSARY